jgi:hypothetical protein
MNDIMNIEKDPSTPQQTSDSLTNAQMTSAAKSPVYREQGQLQGIRALLNAFQDVKDELERRPRKNAIITVENFKPILPEFVETVLEAVKHYPGNARMQRDGGLLLAEVAGKFGQPIRIPKEKQKDAGEESDTATDTEDDKDFICVDVKAQLMRELDTVIIPMLRRVGPDTMRNKDQDAELGRDFSLQHEQDICVAGCRLVAVLGQRNKAYQAEIAGLGVLELVVEVLRDHRKYVDIGSNGNSGNSGNPNGMNRTSSNSSSNASSGKYGCSISGSDEDENNKETSRIEVPDDIIIHACWAIMNLASKNKDNQKRVGDAGGVPVLLELLKKVTGEILYEKTDGKKNAEEREREGKDKKMALGTLGRGRNGERGSSKDLTETQRHVKKVLAKLNVISYLSGCVAAIVENSMDNQTVR